MDTTAPGTAIILNQAGAFCYTNPVEIVCAATLADVRPAMERVDQQVAQGHTAVGFISYEASPAFDAALQTHAPSNLPLLWFGMYSEPVSSRSGDVPPPPVGSADSEEGEPGSAGGWASTIEASQYHAAFERIRDYIAAGDTYQVNYT
ncbi:MAG: hypothetical protein IT368_15410, partial [Candidatus Hydrogenedentes bacterium]|nr:hypothetical protein [Candidatus Hydrogenedentota bacterium]